MQLRLCFLVVVTVAQAMSADQTNETDIDDGSAVPDFQTSKESAALDEEVNVTTEDSNVSTRAFGNSTAELEIRSTTPEATVDLQSTTSFVTDDGAITVENSSTATGGETTTSTIEENSTNPVASTGSPEDTCVDLGNPKGGRSQCRRNKRLCKQTGFIDFMKNTCPKTCGYCKLCLDEVSKNGRGFCSQGNVQRLCSSSVTRTRSSTQRRCPVACGVCEAGTVIRIAN